MGISSTWGLYLDANNGIGWKKGQMTVMFNYLGDLSMLCSVMRLSPVTPSDLVIYYDMWMVGATSEALGYEVQWVLGDGER